jgi:phosphoribosylaminoimidazolecarboxamide formyltransferase/IMP cyclohydrolase
MTKIQRALISVFDKTNIVEFAKMLATFNIEILSTGGTAKMIRDAGVGVIDIADYTGSPEVFEGRLKTLHPKVHGGILYKRGDAKHVEQAKANSIGPVDLVVVNLYPFEKVTSDPKCSFENAIENIDIGGPTMVRSAAKNHKDVAIVTDPNDYDDIAKELSESDGSLSDATRFRLAKKAFATTARYDAAIATYLGGLDDEAKKVVGLPNVVGFTFDKVVDMRYGENPHQKAAFYRDMRAPDEPSTVTAEVLHGKKLSYNNIMDADAAIEITKDLHDWPYACVILKHANPCGAAVSEKSLKDAFEKALACDPTSAFGGIIGVTKSLDEKTAGLIAETFFEVVAAPAFDDEAMAVLTKKKNLRLIAVPGLDAACERPGWTLKQVTGGLLVQQRDVSNLDIRNAKVVTKRNPTEEEWAALGFGWRLVKHVKSNAIVYAAADRTIGIGAGQMSRVDASKLAVMKAQSSLKGSALASDAFFPFRDGVDAAAEAGATAIVQPGGSVRDEEVMAAADEHNMAMVFTGERHFRH